ncbi:hypothetical protein DRN69_09495, partial [Candidatus Pacearchaeota archaeon]
HIIVYIASFLGIFTSLVFILTLLDNHKKVKNPISDYFPLVSVIIPAYNEGKNIKKTIESIQQLNYPEEFEIIVVDDGSKDNTLRIAQAIAKKDARIKVIHQKNKGKSAAINNGIKHSKGEFIATLDADSFVDKDSLLKMIGFFKDRKVVAVTPSLKVYNPKTFVQKIQKVEYLWGIFLRKIFSFLNALHVTPGPFSIFRKKFFDKYGGFDENNPTEDTEMAMRIQSHHYKIENSIDALVYTVAPKTFKELLIQRIRWYYGLMKNLKLYPHLFNPKYGYIALFSLPAAILSVLVILFLVAYFGVLAIKSLMHNIANWNSIGFDLFTLMQGFKWDYLYYKLTSPLIALIIILALFNIFFFIYAEIKSKEKNKLDVAYIYYFCFYAYFYALWWVAAIFYWVIGKVKWKEISYG